MQYCEMAIHASHMSVLGMRDESWDTAPCIMHHTWASNIRVSYAKLKPTSLKDTLLPSSWPNAYICVGGHHALALSAPTGDFWAYLIKNPSRVSKSTRLHGGVFRVFFDKLEFITQIPLKWWLIFPRSWTSTGYFLNSTGSPVTSSRLSPFLCDFW